MAKLGVPKKWTLSAWLKKHFTNRFFDGYADLLALSERTAWSIKHTLNHIITFVMPQRRTRLGKPKVASFLPRVELLEVRQMPTTYTWTGLGTDNNWTDTSNWSGGASYPSSGDTAIISTAGADVVFNAAVNIANLTLSAGTLDLDSSVLQLWGSSSSWTGGTITNGTLSAGGALDINGAVTLSQAILNVNDGVAVTWSGGNITLNNSATLLNMGGTFAIQSDADVLDGGTGTNEVDNEGTLEKTTTTGTTSIEANFVQGDGSVSVDSGTLDFSAETLTFEGGTITSATSTGATVKINSGDLATADGVAITAGTVDVAGTLKLEGTSDWSGGTISITGTLDVQSGAVLDVTGSASVSVTAGTLENYGTVDWTEGDIASTTATVINESDATFTMADGIDLTGDSVSSTFDNDGTLVVGGLDSAGTNVIDGDFTQSSTGELDVEIQSLSVHDQLEVEATADIDGTLHVEPLAGLNLGQGGTVPVLTADSVTGTFSSKSITGFPSVAETSYTGTQADVIFGGSLSTGPAPNGPTSPVGGGNVSLLTGNLNIQVAADQDENPLDQDTLYYYPGLEYNSDTADPTPIIGVSVPTQTSDANLTDIKAQLVWDGTTQTMETFHMPSGSTPGLTYDFALQVAPAVTSTGLYDFSVNIEEDYSSSDATQTLTGSDFVVVNAGTPFGNGWSLTDENHLYFDGSGNAYLVHGNGGYTYFTYDGSTYTFASSSASYSGLSYESGSLVATGSGYTFTAADMLQWNYNSSGLLTSVVDPVGISVVYSYDSSNRLTSVLDPDNNEVQYQYDTTTGLLSDLTQGYVSGGTFYGLATTSMKYDGNDNLTAVIDPEGSTRTFGYNADSKLTSDSFDSAGYTYTYGELTGSTLGGGLASASFAPQLLDGFSTSTAVISSDYSASVTNGDGYDTGYQFDSSGQLLEETLPDGGTETLTYNSSRLLASVTDSNGQTTRYTYVPDTQEISTMVTPDGLTTTYSYGASTDQPTKMVDGYGNTTTYNYDSYGDLTEQVNPDGSTVGYTYSAGMVQTSIDSLGDTTNYYYDPNRRLTETVDSLGDTTLYSYDLATGAVTVVDPDGATSVSNYDGSGQMPTQVDALGQTTLTDYDANNKVTATVDPLGQTSYQQYDSAGQLTATVDPKGDTTLQLYDTANQVTATVNADGKTSYQYYDGDGNVTESIDSDSHTTFNYYDSANQVTETVDPTGATTYQDYDSAGLLTASVNADGKTTFYAYDPNQRLTETINPDGDTTIQIYDTKGNVTATVDGNGVTSYQYYDAAGSVTEAIDGDGHTTRTDYDAAGHATATIDADGHTAYTYYDANGNVTESIDAAGHTTLTFYDPAGQATAAVDADGHTTYTDYDLNGNVTATVDADGHTSYQFYDANNQVTAAVDAGGHTTFTDYDAAGQVTATVDALGTTSYTYYDPSGQVTATVNALGQTTLTDYDAAGQVTATVDALGYTTFTDYDKDGRVTATVDPDGHTSFTYYDAAGQATESIDADGHTSRTDYDPAGQVTATVDALGHTTFMDYDKDGRVTATVDPNGKTTLTDYDDDGNVTATVDALGHTSFTDYDASGQVTATVDASGQTSFTDFDADGKVTATVDALGKTTLTDYDANGNVTATVDADGYTAFTRYDANGQVTANVDANGNTSQTMYDAAGNVTETVDADGHTTHNYYDADNRLTESVNNDAQTALTYYDAGGNVTKAVDFNGFTTKQFYDADNRVTASVDAYGNTSYQVYDASGNVTEAIDGDGNTTYTDYDANGKVTATVDGRGYTSFTYYDADGHVTASVDQDGDTTQYQFDADGNQTAVIDPDLNTTTMAYDIDNRLTETISPSAGTSYQYYDADGNVTETIAANGGSIITSYDADDRVTHAVWYESSFTVDTQNKTYDNDGKLLTASNVNGTYSFSYDPDGRVTQVSEPFGETLNYAYDGDGNQTQVVDSFGGTETSVYDLQDRLVTREYTGEGENLRVDFTYTANNQIATETDYYNLAGTDLVGSTTYAYDADQNVTSIVSYNASSSVIESFAYTYDRAGNLSTETDTQQGAPTTTTYTYDDANQLTGAGGSSYSYDANGNRTMTGYTTGAGNELTSDGTYDYTYDASGQEITKSDIATGDKWTYEYNSGGELVSAEEQTSLGAIENQISYEYDIFGQLIQEDANGTITKYAVDGWNPAKMGATGTSNFDVWATFTSGGSLITRQIQGDGVDQHLAFVTSSTTTWYLVDNLGSTRATINNSGTVQDSIVYDAYGNITSQSNASAAPLYTYTGRELDTETGLQYNRARWYDPSTGRWITQDPMGFDAGDNNLYRYASNRPTAATDPSGMQPIRIPQDLSVELGIERNRDDNWIKNNLPCALVSITQDSQIGIPGWPLGRIATADTCAVGITVTFTSLWRVPIKQYSLTEDIFQLTKIVLGGGAITQYHVKDEAHPEGELIDQAVYESLDEKYYSSTWEGPKVTFTPDPLRYLDDDPPKPFYSWSKYSLRVWDAPGNVGTINGINFTTPADAKAYQGATIYRTFWIRAYAKFGNSTSMGQFATTSSFTSNGTTWN